MTKRFLLPSILMLIVAAPAFAQRDRTDRTDPGLVARRCMGRMHIIADRTVHRIAHRTHHCVRIVKKLLDLGAEEKAREVGARCIESINETAHRAVTRIERLVAECTEILVEMGAPDIFLQAVQRAGEATAGAVRSARNRAVQAIEELFTD